MKVLTEFTTNQKSRKPSQIFTIKLSKIKDDLEDVFKVLQVMGQTYSYLILNIELIINFTTV